MKKGNKVAEYCRVELCPHYETIYALSTMADLKNDVICPKVFCDRVWFKDDVKIEQIEEKFLFDKAVEEVKEEYKDVDEKVILKNLCDYFAPKKIKLDMYWDVDDKQQMVSFFNPANSSPTPLTLSFVSLRQNSFEVTTSEIESFFKSFLDQFIEKECTNCKYSATNNRSMSCIDCVRNKKSVSIMKKDRYQE